MECSPEENETLIANHFNILMNLFIMEIKTTSVKL